MKVYANSDYSEYGDLAGMDGVWEDLKSGVGSIFKGAASIFQSGAQAAAPAIVYHAVTGQQMPQQQVSTQPMIVERPTLPTWVVPVGIGAAALGLILLLKKKR